ncbi:hypothetical protein A9Q99_14810 [Gammaproteobacteria bacterium 45_16_T64]|nr:hypothetical protein A9Q99_14810 [Gammaproteobacteria bacterium 45_16_T64]
MIVGTEELYEETKESLERVQGFDVTSLPREDVLGTALNFDDVVYPAQQLIDLCTRLSLTALKDFPDAVLNIVKTQADSIYQLFTQILDFEIGQQDPSSVRSSIINNVIKGYPLAFTALHPYISYSLHRSADFQTLDTEARAMLQAIGDKATSVSGSLDEHESDAKKVLSEIRKVAAEEGVTKQAAHFHVEFEHHIEEADKWQFRGVVFAFCLGLYAILSIFLHKVPILVPENTYDAIQLSISKFLIFFVMAYMLFLSMKNFQNHKHNAIVNKHRQNALMTHGALVEASGEDGVRDAVLLQAASCIFSPQSTGYTPSNDGDLSNQKSVVEILSKPIVQTAVKESLK